MSKSSTLLITLFVIFLLIITGCSTYTPTSPTEDSSIVPAGTEDPTIDYKDVPRYIEDQGPTDLYYFLDDSTIVWHEGP